MHICTTHTKWQIKVVNQPAVNVIMGGRMGNPERTYADTGRNATVTPQRQASDPGIQSRAFLRGISPLCCTTLTARKKRKKQRNKATNKLTKTNQTILPQLSFNVMKCLEIFWQHPHTIPSTTLGATEPMCQLLFHLPSSLYTAHVGDLASPRHLCSLCSKALSRLEPLLALSTPL